MTLVLRKAHVSKHCIRYCTMLLSLDNAQEWATPQWLGKAPLLSSATVDQCCPFTQHGTLWVLYAATR